MRRSASASSRASRRSEGAASRRLRTRRMAPLGSAAVSGDQSTLFSGPAVTRYWIPDPLPVWRSIDTSPLVCPAVRLVCAAMLRAPRLLESLRCPLKLAARTRSRTRRPGARRRCGADRTSTMVYAAMWVVFSTTT